MKQVVAKVDEELHRAVKAKAAREGKTITSVIKRLLEGWVEEDNEHLAMCGEGHSRDAGS